MSDAALVPRINQTDKDNKNQDAGLVSRHPDLLSRFFYRMAYTTKVGNPGIEVATSSVVRFPVLLPQVPLQHLAGGGAG